MDYVPLHCEGGAYACRWDRRRFARSFYRHVVTAHVGKSEGAILPFVLRGDKMLYCFNCGSSRSLFR